MTHMTFAPEQPETAGPACAHHWVLEPAAGAASRGHCRRCGEDRLFRNSTSDAVWEDERRSAFSFWSGDSRAASQRLAAG